MPPQDPDRTTTRIPVAWQTSHSGAMVAPLHFVHLHEHLPANAPGNGAARRRVRLHMRAFPIGLAEARRGLEPLPPLAMRAAFIV